MRARIHMPKIYRADANEYVRKELRKQQLILVRRTMKIVSVVLHENHGFGKQRLTDLWRKTIEHTDIMAEDEVAWYHIDRELIDIVGLNVEREDYELVDD